MTRSIGFGAEQVALHALKWIRTSTVLVVAMFVVIGLSLTGLRFDEEINRVFLSDSPVSQLQRQYEAELSPPQSVTLALVTSPTPFTASQMSALRDVSLDLEFIDGVIGVGSPFVLRMPPGPGSPSGQAVFPVNIPEAYAPLLERFQDLNTGLPTFISEDRTALLMAVTVDLDQTDVATALPALEAEFARALPPTMTVVLTGEDAISAEIVRGLKVELLQLNLWGAVLVAVATLALLRDLRMTVLTVVPALCGASGVLALSVWLDYRLTVLSNVVPILLLVLGVANGVHMARYMKNAQASVAKTLREIGPACALTAITTSAAFASIMLSRNDQVIEFAVLGTIGTMLSFLIASVVFALLATIIGRMGSRGVSNGAGLAQRLTALGVGHSRVVTGVGILLLGLSCVGFMQTRPWFDLHHNLPGNSVTKAANDAVSDTFGGVFQMIVDVDSDSTGNGAWETTRQLAGKLGEIAGQENVVSEVSLARWLGRPDQVPAPEQISMLPDALVAALRPTHATHRIFVSMPEPMRSDETLRQFDRIYAAAEAGGADRIFGLPVVMRQEATNLIAQLSNSLILASLGATLIVALAFRTIRIVPVLLVVNVLPLMLTGTALHLFMDGKITPTGVLALTIAFGIAIDDTVHFLNRFQKARTQGDDVDRALNSAARTAGQAMVLTTMLLSAGLAVTLFSIFGPIRLFGGLIITILWTALLTDLILLPALLTIGTRHAQT